MKFKFLQWRTLSALRKNKSIRTSTPYKRSNSVGIIFTVEDRQKHDDIKDLIRHLEQDGKQVKVLEFLPRKKDNYEFLFDFFTINDLNFWGKITSEHAEKFAQLPFDYLFYIDNQHNPLILNILAQSRAQCRVGSHQEAHEDYFEFMIGSEVTTKGLIENIYKYIRQIR